MFVVRLRVNLSFKSGIASPRADSAAKDAPYTVKDHCRGLSSIGKSFSAFGSAAGKNLSSVCCGHSLAEAVLFLSVNFLRLICSFHCVLPPLYRVRYGRLSEALDPQNGVFGVRTVRQRKPSPYDYTYKRPCCQQKICNFRTPDLRCKVI